MKRLERVLASGDTAAIAAAEQGLQLAESLLERRSHGLRLARPELNEQYKDSFEVPPGSTWKYVKGERGFRRTLVTPARAPVKKT